MDKHNSTSRNGKFLVHSNTVDPGYIELEGNREIVKYIDNLKYKMCNCKA